MFFPGATSTFAFAESASTLQEIAAGRTQGACYAPKLRAAINHAGSSGGLLVTAKNTYMRYGMVAMTFHWVIATLIILNVGLGIYFVQFLDRQEPVRGSVGQCTEF